MMGGVRLRIDVTKADIEAGTRRSTPCIPFIKAVRRAGLRKVEIHLVEGAGKWERTKVRFGLPKTAREWLDRFGRDGVASPITFWVSVRPRHKGRKVGVT